MQHSIERLSDGLLCAVQVGPGFCPLSSCVPVLTAHHALASTERVLSDIMEATCPILRCRQDHIPTEDSKEGPLLSFPVSMAVPLLLSSVSSPAGFLCSP